MTQELKKKAAVVLKVVGKNLMRVDDWMSTYDYLLEPNSLILVGVVNLLFLTMSTMRDFEDFKRSHRK